MTTSVAAANLVVSWEDSPDDHASAITSFIVTFEEADDLNFSTILDYCDPVFNSAAFLAKSCSIPMTVLRADPYSVPIGDLIVAEVAAINAKGTSEPSEPNTSGVLGQDAPTVAPVLARGDQTSEIQIELQWEPPTASLDIGGSFITGFKIYWDSGSQDTDPSAFQPFHTVSDPSQLSYTTTAVT